MLAQRMLQLLRHYTKDHFRVTYTEIQGLMLFDMPHQTGHFEGKLLLIPGDSTCFSQTIRWFLRRTASYQSSYRYIQASFIDPCSTYFHRLMGFSQRSTRTCNLDIVVESISRKISDPPLKIDFIIFQDYVPSRPLILANTERPVQNFLHRND